MNLLTRSSYHYPNRLQSYSCFQNSPLPTQSCCWSKHRATWNFHLAVPPGYPTSKAHVRHAWTNMCMCVYIQICMHACMCVHMYAHHMHTPYEASGSWPVEALRIFLRGLMWYLSKSDINSGYMYMHARVYVCTHYTCLYFKMCCCAPSKYQPTITIRSVTNISDSVTYLE